jgi:hypothetical protein
MNKVIIERGKESLKKLGKSEIFRFLEENLRARSAILSKNKTQKKNFYIKSFVPLQSSFRFFPGGKCPLVLLFESLKS